MALNVLIDTPYTVSCCTAVLCTRGYGFFYTINEPRLPFAPRSNFLYDYTLYPCTFLLATITIGTLQSSSSFSLTIFFLSSCRVCQLDSWSMANNIRNASPWLMELSRNSKNSSCPAVSMISTSCRSNPYSTWAM